MKKIFIKMAVLFFCSLVFAAALHAQTLYYVNTPASYSSTPTLYGEATGSTDNIGVMGIGSYGSNYNVGVHGAAIYAGVTGVGVYAGSGSAVSSNYGIYAVAGGGATNFAGYFNGDVYVTGSYLPSDAKLKLNVVNETSVLARIKKLRPVTYLYNTSLNYINLPKGEQHGFVAQELQEVFPEAVKNIKHPVFTDNKITRLEDITTVNYVALVPVLVKAVQEQQVLIEELQKKYEQLNSQNTALLRLVSDKSIYLADNTPNPANSTATIRYSIPDRIKSAVIGVFDATGRRLMQFGNLKGSSKLVIDTSKLANGTYVYSLIVNGTKAISKKMIVARG